MFSFEIVEEVQPQPPPLVQVLDETTLDVGIRSAPGSAWPVRGSHANCGPRPHGVERGPECRWSDPLLSNLAPVRIASRYRRRNPASSPRAAAPADGR